MGNDLVQELRGPVREAASRLIAGAFRRDGESLEEKQPRFSIPARPTEDDDLVLVSALSRAADTIQDLEVSLARLKAESERSEALSELSLTGYPAMVQRWARSAVKQIVGPAGKQRWNAVIVAGAIMADRAARPNTQTEQERP